MEELWTNAYWKMEIMGGASLPEPVRGSFLGRVVEVDRCILHSAYALSSMWYEGTIGMQATIAISEIPEVKPTYCSLLFCHAKIGYIL